MPPVLSLATLMAIFLLIGAVCELHWRCYQLMYCSSFLLYGEELTHPGIVCQTWNINILEFIVTLFFHCNASLLTTFLKAGSAIYNHFFALCSMSDWCTSMCNRPNNGRSKESGNDHRTKSLRLWNSSFALLMSCSVIYNWPHYLKRKIIINWITNLKNLSLIYVGTMP